MHCNATLSLIFTAVNWSLYCTSVLHQKAVQMLDWWWWQDTARHGDNPLSPAATVHLLKSPRFTPQHCFPFSHLQMFPFPPFLPFHHLNTKFKLLRFIFRYFQMNDNYQAMSTPHIINDWKIKCLNCFRRNSFAPMHCHPPHRHGHELVLPMVDYSKGAATPPSQANS